MVLTGVEWDKVVESHIVFLKLATQQPTIKLKIGLLLSLNPTSFSGPHKFGVAFQVCEGVGTKPVNLRSSKWCNVDMRFS